MSICMEDSECWHGIIFSGAFLNLTDLKQPVREARADVNLGNLLQPRWKATERWMLVLPPAWHRQRQGSGAKGAPFCMRPGSSVNCPWTLDTPYVRHTVLCYSEEKSTSDRLVLLGVSLFHIHCRPSSPVSSRRPHTWVIWRCPNVPCWREQTSIGRRGWCCNVHLG